jgi:hypothetical protein
MPTDSIDQIIALAVAMIAIGACAERFVVAIKTLIPWLAEERKTEAQEVNLKEDKWRRFAVLALSFGGAWVTAAFLAEQSVVVAGSATTVRSFDLFGRIGLAQMSLPAPIVGLLASGGSAFWNSVLGYARAAKDIKVQEKASSNLAYHEQASRLGLRAHDGGETAFINPGNVTMPTAPRWSGHAQPARN